MPRAVTTQLYKTPLIFFKTTGEVDVFSIPRVFYSYLLKKGTNMHHIK